MQAGQCVARRCFSSSSVARQLVKSPMAAHGVDGRYACALYSAASKANTLPVIEKEMAALRELLKTDTVLREFVRDPTHQRSLKERAMKDVLTKLGHSDMSKHFLGAIADNGRMGKLELILRTFDKIMSAHRGETLCQVVTAKVLDASMKKQVESALGAFVKPGEKLQVSYRTEASLIGGMQVTIGDKFIDMSIASKIHTYEQVIHETTK
jgi:F-type H+-transporting ATPase subunit O